MTGSGAVADFSDEFPNKKIGNDETESPTTRARSRQSVLDRAGEIKNSPDVYLKTRALGRKRVIGPTKQDFEQDSDIEAPPRKSRMVSSKPKIGIENSSPRSRPSHGALKSNNSDSKDESRPSKKRSIYINDREIQKHQGSYQNPSEVMDLVDGSAENSFSPLDSRAQQNRPNLHPKLSNELREEHFAGIGHLSKTLNADHITRQGRSAIQLVGRRPMKS